MAEWFIVVDCKSIEFSHRRFKSYFLLNIKKSKYSAAGSASALGVESHVFKSRYFEIFYL